MSWTFNKLREVIDLMKSTKTKIPQPDVLELEIGKVHHSEEGETNFPWRVGPLEAKIVVASDVTFGPASESMQNFGCGMVAKSASVSIFNNGYGGHKQLPDAYQLKFSFDSFKAGKSNLDFKEITGCACMILLDDGSMLCFEPSFEYEEDFHESLA
jgi:hypothetical protein